MSNSIRQSVWIVAGIHFQPFLLYTEWGQDFLVTVNPRPDTRQLSSRKTKRPRLVRPTGLFHFKSGGDRIGPSALQGSMTEFSQRLGLIPSRLYILRITDLLANLLTGVEACMPRRGEVDASKT